MRKPVDMKKGGKIIFFKDAGFFVAFNRTTITATAMMAANILLAIKNNVIPSFFNHSSLQPVQKVPPKTLENLQILGSQGKK